jgi:hypothetical protein
VDDEICKQVLKVDSTLAARAGALRKAIDDATFLLIDASQKDAVFRLVPDDDSRQAIMAT